MFAKVYPDKDVSDVLFMDSIFRAPSTDFILKKAQHPESGTYSYMMTYTFPYDGGHIAWHCSEIPFVFHNTSLVAAYNEPGVTDLLASKKMCDAWLTSRVTANRPAKICRSGRLAPQTTKRL